LQGRVVGPTRPLDVAPELRRQHVTRQWLVDQFDANPPKSLIGIAIRHARGHRDELGRFLKNARLPLDYTHASALCVEAALGRKNYLFVDDRSRPPTSVLSTISSSSSAAPAISVDSTMSSIPRCMYDVARRSRDPRDEGMRQIIAVVVFVTWGTTALGCATRARRPDGPYRAAEEFVDALSDEAVACTREHAPEGTGHIAVANEFSGAGGVPVVSDAGSMPGSEAVIACIRARATEKLRCPERAPARFVRIRVPVPLVTANVKYVFTDQPPSAG
jgi:hypothetical protein